MVLQSKALQECVHNPKYAQFYKDTRIMRVYGQTEVTSSDESVG